MLNIQIAGRLHKKHVPFSTYPCAIPTGLDEVTSTVCRTPESPYMQLASPVSLNIFIFQHSSMFEKFHSLLQIARLTKKHHHFFRGSASFFVSQGSTLPPSHHGGFSHGNIFHGVSHPKCARYGFLKGSYKVPLLLVYTPEN